MKFRKAYDAHQRFTAPLKGESKTQQQFSKECDINHLMARYQKTGLIDHVNQYQGNYSDLTDVPDYLTALNKIQNAQAAFDSLPSSLRNKFQNEPSLFLDFVSNPENLDEMVEMGLATKKANESVPADPPLASDESQPADEGGA